MEKQTYFDRKKFFAWLLLLTAIIGAYFSLTATTTITIGLADFFSSHAAAAVGFALVWEIVKAYSAHQLFNDYFAPPKGKPAGFIDPVTATIFLFVWLAAIGGTIWGAALRADIYKGEILEQQTDSTKSPTPTLLDTAFQMPIAMMGFGAGQQQQKITGIDAAQQYRLQKEKEKAAAATAAAVGSIAEAQKAAINAAAAAALSESKQDSLLTAHKLGNIENKTQKNIIVFLLIDALVIVSICGHSYIYSQYKPAEKTADKMSDRKLLARFCSARQKGNQNLMDYYEQEIQKRNLAVPKARKTT